MSVALGAGAANAASITYTDATIPAVVPVAGLPSDGSTGDVRFPQFDPLIGILSSVEVTLTGQALASMVITGTGTVTSASVSNTYDVIDDLGNLVVDDLLEVTLLYFQAAPPGFNPGAAPGAGAIINFCSNTGAAETTCGPILSSTVDLGTYNPANIGDYVGTGFVDWQVSALSSAILGFAGDVAGSETAPISVTGTVTYTYRDFPPPNGEVPVPAALPLLATALGGIGFMRWRRKNA